MSFKSGFITLIGRPNAGKSTLLNALLHEKVAIMSSKPQTTRDVVQGILTDDEAQIVFIDTPGVHKPQHELGRQMSKAAINSAYGVDVIYFLADATSPYGRGDEFILRNIKDFGAPVFLLLTKIDLLNKEELLDVLLKWQNVFEFAEIIPISAKKEDNLETLLKVTKGYLKEGEMFYPSGQITDHSEKFMCGEMIREKVLQLTNEEVPHSVFVVIDEMKFDRNKCSIHASIVVERDSQKGIIIGKGGSMLKQIGLLARQDIEAMLGKKVYLELFVRVEKDWRNKNRTLTELGYMESK